jgi:L-lactate dehydrogenase complex protein LldG
MSEAAASSSAKARAGILARLTVAPPGRVPAPPAVVPPPPMGDGPYQRFCELLTANRAEVVETTRADWPRAALDWLKAAGCRNALLGPQTPVGKELWAAAYDSDPLIIPYDAAIETFKPALVRDIDAGVTGVRAAVAATGSLVLWPGPDEPRLMSLLPPVHLAVVFKSTLRTTLAEVIREQGWAENGMPTNVVVVSGPSKTADIAQILAFGVHGPKRLAVLVVTDG